MSDTPITDAAILESKGHWSFAMRDKMATLERENAAMSEAIRVSLIRAYTAGYQHGHEATVEGEFIPVHSSDETEFHAENIHQLMHDGSLPELQPFLKP